MSARTTLRVFKLMLSVFVLLMVSIASIVLLHPDFDKGKQGEIGMTGATGDHGVKGAKGAKGDTGATGEKGAKGAGFWGASK